MSDEAKEIERLLRAIKLFSTSPSCEGHATALAALAHRLLTERNEARESIIEHQRHRDRWRTHAYGRGPRPDDFLSGNMIEEDRGPTATERIASLERELEEEKSRAVK